MKLVCSFVGMWGRVSVVVTGQGLAGPSTEARAGFRMCRLWCGD